MSARAGHASRSAGLLQRCPAAVASPAGTHGRKGRDSASGASQQRPGLPSDDMTPSCLSTVCLSLQVFGFGGKGRFPCCGVPERFQQESSRVTSVWACGTRSWGCPAPSLPACSAGACRSSVQTLRGVYRVQFVVGRGKKHNDPANGECAQTVHWC